MTNPSQDQRDRELTLEEMHEAWARFARYRLYSHCIQHRPMKVYLEGRTGLTHEQAQKEANQRNAALPESERGFGGLSYGFEIENKEEALVPYRALLAELRRQPAP